MMWTVIVGIDPGVVRGEQAIQSLMDALEISCTIQCSGNARLVRDDDEAIACGP
jgi:hypothetical protein